MKHLAILLAVMGLTLGLVAGPAGGDDGFYVIAGGGPSGKVLKTQVLTSTSQNTTVGDNNWAKLSTPQWTYTKLSATSYLVITYQDTLNYNNISGSSLYQLRANDQPSVAGQGAAQLICPPKGPNNTLDLSCSATGVWSGLPKGDVNLSIWHRLTGSGGGCT
jgi:hypothetical protein